MSVTDPAVELTICATDRELRRHWQAVRCVVAGGSYLFSATRTDKTAPAWQAPARLTIARCACTATRQSLDDWRNWTPSDQQYRLASTGFAGLLWSTRVLAGCTKVGYISTEIGGCKDNECYIHTWRTDGHDTIIQHKVIRAVNLV